jgi:anti-sigma-K factor RskA
MTPNDRMARAEDYVFGLMNEQERARAERDMEVDPQFRECVVMLGQQLRRLREPNVPISISDNAWRDITRRLASMPQMTGAATAAGMAGVTLPGAGDPSRKGHLKMKRPYAEQFGGWKGTVVALGLVAALGVGYVVGQQSAPLPSPVAVAMLDDADGEAGAFVEAWPDRSVRLVPISTVDVPEGKVLQFWIDGVPYGVMPRSLEGLLRGPELPLPREGAIYDLTLEDAPGVRQGQRPGPTVLTGEAKPIAR